MPQFTRTNSGMSFSSSPPSRKPPGPSRPVPRLLHQNLGFLKTPTAPAGAAIGKKPSQWCQSRRLTVPLAEPQRPPCPRSWFHLLRVRDVIVLAPRGPSLGPRISCCPTRPSRVGGVISIRLHIPPVLGPSSLLGGTSTLLLVFPEKAETDA